MSFNRCIKGSLLPPVASTGWIFRTSAIGCVDGSFSKLSFGESFALAVPKSNLTAKTLLLTIWSVVSRVDREDDEECLGSTQVSLADKDLFGNLSPISSCWYNVLNFHFVMGAAGTSTPKPASSLNRKHFKQDSDLSNRSTLKEESSDDSTIISSQASTLTRNVVALESVETGSDLFEKALKQLAKTTLPSEPLLADKQTNTECVFVAPNAGLPKNHKRPVLVANAAASVAANAAPDPGLPSSLVRRSQTFTPSAPVNKSDYVCKVIVVFSRKILKIVKKKSNLSYFS